jgi:hypothetical protein
MSDISDIEVKSGRSSSFAWAKWISLFSALSFLVLGFDALLSHLNALELNRFTLTPIIFSPIAVALCLAAVFSIPMQRLGWIAGSIAVAVGLAGTIFHFVTTIGELSGFPFIDIISYTARPIFAPAAFASTGVLMIFVAVSESRR